MSLQSASQRREQNRADARRAILEATETILVEEGYDAFSMRKLVDRCGYTAPTIYTHFGDKPGLIDALLEERLSLLVDDLHRVPASPNPIESLRALMLAFARFGRQNPTHYQLLTQPREASTPPPAAGEEARILLEQPLNDIDEAGLFESGQRELVGQSLWACLHGLISLPTTRTDVDWCKDLVEQSLDAVIRGWFQIEPIVRGTSFELAATHASSPAEPEERE
jgi:AcrR family transcriptional regulator